MFLRSIFAAMMLVLGAASFSAAAAEPVRIVASDGNANDRFGASIAANASLVAVGAPDADINGVEAQGAVYLFVRDSDCTLREVAKLVASDGGSGHRFGTSLAVGDDMVLVGATGARGEQAGHGAVYVFTRDGDRWIQADKLYAEDGFTNANFGAAVATDNRTIMVGTPQASGEFGPPGSYIAGAVHVFEKRRGDWQQIAELRADRSSFMEAFGASVAVRDRVALVGAPGHRDGEGAFYLFQRDDDDDDDGWEEEDRERPARDGPASRTGASMTSSADHFAVGAPGASSNDTYMSGVVYLYERKGDDIDSVARLIASDWNAGDAFGSALDMDRDRLLVAAGNAGKIYVFERNDNWAASMTLTAPGSGESFARSVALAGNLAVAGAPGAAVEGRRAQGVVYVYGLSD